VVGLDIAGIDLVAKDISQPLGGQRGAIVEVNAGPGLLMHLKPADGQARPVGKAIVDSLFADDSSGRIPIVGIAGSHGKTLVAKIVARLLHLSGQYVGLACSDGLYLDQRLIEKRNSANWTSAQKLLMNRRVEAAVIENSVATILNEGLGYDRCQVGVITNLLPEQHYGEAYIDSPEQVYNVLRTQVDVVLSGGKAVLNAGYPLLAEMAELCDGEVIFFAQNADLPVIVAHIKENGQAVLVVDDRIVLAMGNAKIVLTKLSAIPFLQAQCHGEKLDHVLAAIATAWALGLSPTLIRAGIETF